MGTLDDSERVNDLYACYGQLADCKGEEVGEKEVVFKKIIGAVNGCDKEKRLVSQFIPVFFKHFPRLTEMALDAQLDLCEDAESTVRRQAIKDLPILCRDCPRLTKRIVIILTQLLVSKDPLELRIVHSALISIFKTDPKALVMGLSHQICCDKQLRDKCLRFMSFKICNHIDALKPEASETIIYQVNVLLKIAALEEIPLIFKVLFSAYKSINQGYTGIINTINEQLRSALPFDPTDIQTLDRIIMLLKHALFLFIRNYNCGNANDTVEILCVEILPYLDTIPNYNEGKAHALEILQILAELIMYIEVFPQCDEIYSYVFSYTLKCLPIEDDESSANKNGKTIHFSYIECILFILHTLTRLHNSQFPSDSSRCTMLRTRLVSFHTVMKENYQRLRQYADILSSNNLQWLIKNHVRGVKRKLFESAKDIYENNYVYPFVMSSQPRLLIKWKDIKISDSPDKESDADKPKEFTKNECNDLIGAAIYTCRNIFKLIRDFLLTPTKCESVITLSFVPDEIYDKEADGYEVVEYDKRSKQFHERLTTSALRTQRPLYIPPNKRFSSSFRRPH